MKVVTDVAEGGGTVYVGLDSPAIVIPERPSHSPGGVSARLIDQAVAQEERLYVHKLPAALAYARANGLNRIVSDSADARIGVVAAGKAWQDVLESLDRLGLADKASALPLRLLKVGMVWPLDPVIVREFARGLDLIVVIEEKRPLLEDQIRAILYGGCERAAHRRQIFRRRRVRSRAWRARHSQFRRDLAGDGRRSARTARSRGAIRTARSPNRPAAPTKRSAIGWRQSAVPASAPAARITARPASRRGAARWPASAATRWRCSGEPAADDHRLAHGRRRRDVARTAALHQAGTRLRQLGDGTYAHSGMLAIRQAVAADVPMTYKILFNGFVSMTGGQPIEGGMTPPQILAELAAEGVKKMALVVDDPDRYARVALPAGVSLRHRDAMDETQREFREFKGVSVILYDQPCATERRRLRKRGKWADPAIRTFIHPGGLRRLRRLRARLQLHGDRAARDRVRTQAADQPVKLQQGFLLRRGVLPELRDRSRRTPAQGRRRGSVERLPAGDPGAASCRKSASAIACSSPGSAARASSPSARRSPSPPISTDLYSSNLDLTGLSQKYGAVTSHVRMARDPDALHATRIPVAGADALIGCDLIVAAGDECVSKLRPGARAVISADLTPTADFARNPDWSVDADGLIERLKSVLGDGAFVLDGQRLAEELLGEAIAANMLMLGAAWQKGLVPIRRDVDRARHRAQRRGDRSQQAVLRMGPPRGA